MKTVRYIISNSGSISLVIGREVFQIAPDHPNYIKILDALKGWDYDALPNLINISKAIVQMANESNTGVDKVEIKNGLVYYDGYVVDNSLTRRIINLMQDNFPLDPMLKFLDNLMQNPSARAIKELYTFLECNKLPITEDGCFLAYKRVSDSYKDLYTDTIDNNIGANPKKDRETVCDDQNQTCATGLHFCSKEYLSSGAYHEGEGHIMIIKLNPKDVVSIPTDYNNSKGRCCEYVVVDEYKVVETKGTKVPEKFNKSLYNKNGGAYLGTKPDGKAFWNKRDRKGHFIKRSKKEARKAKKVARKINRRK